METLHLLRGSEAQILNESETHKGSLKSRTSVNPPAELRPAITQIKLLGICALENQLHKFAQMLKIVMHESPVLPRFNNKTLT